MRSGVLIFPIDDSAPQTGRYSVVLRKKCAERALGIARLGEGWAVFIDGEPVASPNADWKEALGYLYKFAMLTGKPLSPEEYSQLITNRLNDRNLGIDPDKPINQNESRIAL